MKSISTEGIGSVKTEEDCLPARGVVGKKDPQRTSSNIQRSVGHGSYRERRRFVVSSNHHSTLKPGERGDENPPSQNRQPVGATFSSPSRVLLEKEDIHQATKGLLKRRPLPS